MQNTRLSGKVSSIFFLALVMDLEVAKTDTNFLAIY